MFTYQTPIKYYRLHYIHYHNDILINNPPSLIIRVYNAKLGGGYPTQCSEMHFILFYR